MANKNSVSARAPAVDVSPPNIAKRHSVTWRGLQVETFRFTQREPFEYKFQGDRHLLIAAEVAARDDGETCVEGLPKSRLNDLSGKLTFIPAGHKFRSWHHPRVLSRSIFLYIDPESPILQPEVRLNEIELRPRLFFPDRDLWETALKLKRAADTPSHARYAEALELVLAHELVRSSKDSANPQHFSKGGLAAWQKKQIAEYIEEHLTEDIALTALAQLARLSFYHFSRAFKESFGTPPHRYHLTKRIEHAKALLAKPGISVTEAGMKMGFSETSAFSAAFRRIALQSPSQYRRSLE